MVNGGVFLIDGDNFKEIGFIPTGIGTHGFVVSCDGKWRVSLQDLND